jgi:hypothetical protein
MAGMERVMRPGGIATPEGLSAAFHAGMQHLAAHKGDVRAALASAKAARSGHGSKPAADHTDFAVAASATANGAKFLSEVAAGLEAAAGVAETAGIGVSAAMLLDPTPAGAGEEQALREYRAKHAGAPGAHGFEQPPPTPPLPGLVPPPLPQTKPGEGGFTQAPESRPLPGFTPSPPSAPVHPGRPAEANKPLIVEGRKDGISSGAASELASVLAPGGQVVGTVNPGAGQDIKTVTRNEFAILKAELLQNAQPIRSPSLYKDYKGTVYVLPNGEVFGLRVSALNGETMDIFATKTNLIPKGFKVHQK